MVDFAVSANFGANASKFLSTMHAMRSGVSAFAKSAIPGLGLVSKAFHSIAGQVAIGNLVSRGIQSIGRGMVNMVKSVPEFADRAQMIGRTAGIIGTTAENWQRLGYAAKMTDTNVEGLQGAMQKLNRNMADLSVGKGTLMDIVKFGPPGLGKMIRGTHDTTEAMFLLADAFQKTKDPQVRARMAVAAFGKAGQDMIPMLALGRAGMQKLMAAANNVIPDSTIASASAFDDNLKRVRLTMDGLKSSILGTLIKAANPFLDKLRIWVEANKELVAQRVEEFIKNFGNGIRAAVPYLEAGVRVVGWLVKNWPFLALVYVGWTAAQIALNVALSANPIGAVIIAVEALVVAVIMVIHYWKEITGALNAAWNWFDRLYNKSLLLRNAIFFLASPIWLVVEAVRTLVDILSGRGWQSFQNFIPPWLKGATDKLGISSQNANQGYWNNSQAPNKGVGAMRFINQVNVDNTAAPGVKSNVRVAPQLTGAEGMQYAAGGAH